MPLAKINLRDWLLNVKWSLSGARTLQIFQYLKLWNLVDISAVITFTQLLVALRDILRFIWCIVVLATRLSASF
jgi:hypothetical protein